jgi:hypothetical protein
MVPPGPTRRPSRRTMTPPTDVGAGSPGIKMGSMGSGASDLPGMAVTIAR